MSNFIIAVVLLIIALTTIAVRKAYFFVPPRELKRRAQHHDPEAEKLYQAVAHNGSLEILLDVSIALASGIGFVLLARVAPIWLSFIAVALLLGLAFSWLPKRRTSRFGLRLALLVTPAIARLLHSLHPLLRRLVHQLQKRSTAAHTGLFERSDLLHLIEQQHGQPDNRMTSEELEIAHRALSFGDYLVGDVLIPASQVKTVAADDTIGPILIDELHKTGYALVPVIEGSKQKPVFVGALRTQTLGLQSRGTVRDLMEPAVYYLHEDDSLSEALHAFYATNYPLFIVVNNQQKYIGVLTIDAILEQLLGQLPDEGYEHYSDRNTIASRHQEPPANEPGEQPLPEPEKPLKNLLQRW